MASQLQAREYLVLGDSNVKRFYTKIGLSQAQNLDFIQARNVEEVSNALSSFKRTYKFIVMAFWSNLIVDAGEAASNDVDRMTNIDEMFNSILPLIRYVKTCQGVKFCFHTIPSGNLQWAPTIFIFLFPVHVLVGVSAHFRLPP